MTGIDYQTGADSSEKRRELLNVHGGAILIIRLQGYLFFGTADRLRRRVQRRMTEGGQRPHFLVIDFRRVTGLDSSAVVSFIRLGQTAEREGFLVVLTGLSAADVEALARGGFTSAVNGNVRFETDIERGLKWCEDTLLADVSPDLSGAHRRPLAGLIADIVPERYVAEGMLDALQGRDELRRALIVRPVGARDALPDGLRERGVDVQALELYETHAEPLDGPQPLHDGDRIRIGDSEFSYFQ